MVSALRANAVQQEAMLGYLVTVLAGHFFLELFDSRIEELRDGPAMDA